MALAKFNYATTTLKRPRRMFHMSKSFKSLLNQMLIYDLLSYYYTYHYLSHSQLTLTDYSHILKSCDIRCVLWERVLPNATETTSLTTTTTRTTTEVGDKSHKTPRQDGDACDVVSTDEEVAHPETRQRPVSPLQFENGGRDKVVLSIITTTITTTESQDDARSRKQRSRRHKEEDLCRAGLYAFHHATRVDEHCADCECCCCSF